MSSKIVFLIYLKDWGNRGMELKFNKNRQLRVRLAIIESQLKQAKNEIRRLKKISIN